MKYNVDIDKAPTIFMTCGIPGSGKSKFADFFGKYFTIEINADNIRKELTGDISDQSKNAEVWKEVDRKTTARLAGNYNVFLSNTNLDISCIERLSKKYPFNKIVIFLMKDSLDSDLCWKRIQNDLKIGIDRSNVPEDVFNSQYERFKTLVGTLKAKRLQNTEVFWVDQNFNMEEEVYGN